MGNKIQPGYRNNRAPIPRPSGQQRGVQPYLKGGGDIVEGKYRRIKEARPGKSFEQENRDMLITSYLLPAVLIPIGLIGSAQVLISLVAGKTAMQVLFWTMNLGDALPLFGIVIMVGVAFGFDMITWISGGAQDDRQSQPSSHVDNQQHPQGRFHQDYWNRHDDCHGCDDIEITQVQTTHIRRGR